MRHTLDRLEALPRRQFLAALLLVALVLRVAAVLLLRDPAQGPHPSAGQDGIDFDLLAWQLASGHGFSWGDGTLTAYRAIGFPFSLSLVYRLVGHAFPVAYLFFVATGVAAVVAIHASSRALLGELGGRIAAVLAAFHPILIYLTTEFLSEELFVLLTACAMWVAIGMRHKRIAGPLLCGLLLSAAMLVRPQALFLIPGFLALYLVRDRSLAGALLFALTFTAAQLPWIARNARVTGAFVLVATNGGHTLSGSNNDMVTYDQQYRGSWVPPWWLSHDTTVDSTGSELQRDRAERQQGMQWIREHPLRFGKLVAWKLRNLVTPWDTTSGNRRFKLATALAGAPAMALLLLGVGVAIRRRVWQGSWLVVHGALLGVLGMTVMFYGSPRLRDAFAAFLLPYAALAVLALAGIPVEGGADGGATIVTRATRATSG